MFGPALPAAIRYAQWLAGAGVERGLIGPREVDRLWPRHLFNCAALRGPVDDALAGGRGGRVCDLGSGAGLPGVVLALLRPDLDLVLLEPLLRRVTFLEEVVADLHLTGTTVRRGRAEEVAGSMAADVVVARAVAPLDRLAGWAGPLLRPGGQLLALKGDRAAAELDQAGRQLDRLGVGRRDVVTVTVGGESTQVVRLVYDGDGGTRSRPTARGRTGAGGARGGQR